MGGICNINGKGEKRIEIVSW